MIENRKRKKTGKTIARKDYLLTTYFTPGNTSLIHATSASTSGLNPLLVIGPVPNPPGITNTSISPDALSNVWVGTTDCAILALNGLGSPEIGPQETGSRVLAMMERERVEEWGKVGMRIRVLRASRGPKTSRTSNCGKRRRA